MSRVAALLLVALVAGCGGSTVAAPAPSSTGPRSVVSLAPTPSGPVTPTAGETLAAFWHRRGVSPPPPAGLLDSYAALPLPTSSPYVAAALRQLSGEAYTLDHLRLDLVDAGVLGAPGLSGDRASIIAAQQVGLTGTTTTLQSVLGASVYTVPAAAAKNLDGHVVVLRLRYGPFVGTYADGTHKTLPAAAPTTIALAGHLVTTSQLGTFLYVTAEVDCSTAAAGSVSKTACATLR